MGSQFLIFVHQLTATLVDLWQVSHFIFFIKIKFENFVHATKLRLKVPTRAPVGATNKFPVRGANILSQQLC